MAESSEGQPAPAEVPGEHQETTTRGSIQGERLRESMMLAVPESSLWQFDRLHRMGTDPEVPRFVRGHGTGPVNQLSFNLFYGRDRRDVCAGSNAPT